MKKHLIYLLASAAMMAGCATEKPEMLAMPEGHGALRIACSPSVSFASAAGADSPVTMADITPAAGEFKLSITGIDYDQSWPTLNAFAAEGDHFLLRGDYTATVSYGDITKEGFNKPYYSGSELFTILPRRVAEVTITAKAGNSKITVEATERFCTYFQDVSLTLTTSSGGRFNFNFASTATPAVPDSDEPLYVQPNTTFTLSGTAFKQPATATSKPIQVTLPTQQDVATAPQKHYIYRFDAKNTGSAVLQIILDDSVEEIEIDEELNEGANPDKK